nr:unnamed protein product [Callosobruchus chinensis]
MQFREGQFD